MTHHISHADPIVATGGMLTGGIVGAVLGSVFGPIGTAFGAAAGTITGAGAGEQISAAIEHHDDMAYLANVFSRQDYYVSEMEWEDYEAAYRYGFSSFAAMRHISKREAKHLMANEWQDWNQRSHLSWRQAWPAVLHAWEIERSKPVPLAA